MNQWIAIVIVFWMVGIAYADPSAGQRLYEQALQTQNVEERIALLKASLEKHRHFDAFYALGLAYQEADSLDQAEAVIREGIGITHDDQRAFRGYIAIGQLYNKQERPTEALQMLEKAHELMPSERLSDAIQKQELNLMRQGVPATQITRALVTSRGIGVEPRINLWVFFEFNSDALSVPGRRQAQALGEALSDSAFRDEKFSLVGHTDRHGSDAYNLGLSRRRAESVKRFLVDHCQIAEEMIRTEGKGKRALRFQEATAQADSLNRRVEVIWVQERD